MFKYEGLLCPVCKAKLFEDDEIAVCPVCGAPHHKKCMLSNGGCGYQESHGTDEQWTMPQNVSEPEQESASDTEKEIGESLVDNETGETSDDPSSAEASVKSNCAYCGGSLLNGAAYCPHCGSPATPDSNGDSKYVFIRTVNGDYKLPNEELDGIKTIDLARFVGVNFARYLKVFSRFVKNHSKISWNWMAFLFPDLWAWSRKCYSIGAVLSAFSVLFTSIFYCTPFYAMLIGEDATKQLDTFVNSPQIYIFSALVLFMFVLRVLSGLFADKIYQSIVFSRIKQLRENDVGRQEIFRYGGVNLILALAASFISSELAMIVSSFLL